MTKHNVIERMVDTLNEMIEEMERWQDESFHMASEQTQQLIDELELVE